jgi:arsenate reductase (glutaredoxin)
MSLTLLHNPRCRKSREALALLDERKISYEACLYLVHPPDKTFLKNLIAKAGGDPLNIVRKEESYFKEHLKGNQYSVSEWVDILHEHPVLIQRPILISDDKAIVGRPPENILSLL